MTPSISNTPHIVERLRTLSNFDPEIVATREQAAAVITAYEAALKGIDEQLWATHGSNNVEALIACLKEIERLTRAALAAQGRTP